LPQRKIRQITTTEKRKMKPSNTKFVVFAFFIAFTRVASLTLDERMDWAAEDPKGYLNWEIQQHLLEIPRKIDTAVEKSEEDLTSFVIQRKSQGRVRLRF
jgi:hypothetical protein